MRLAKPREYLLDVSRLIWRVWEGRLPTGIDRVCLEYVRRFGSRSRAVVQFRGRIFVLSAQDSAELFVLLVSGRPDVRRRLIGFGPAALLRARRSPSRPGIIYLNVGHTGLHEAALPKWITQNAVKAVHLVHDLIPITHPEFCRPGESAKHIKRVENALKSAAAILANSQATLDDLAAFASARQLPMPPATVSWLAPAGRPCRDLEPALLERPYFVTVGTIEGRKNHLLLLEVWREIVAQLRTDAPSLVIIGQRGWQAEAVEAILDNTGDLTGYVLELGRCTDDELASWLKDARALLMPSFTEGFGLPLVEALACGTPVIATDLPVYREIAGDIPTYLGPDDRNAWKHAICGFMADDEDRNRQKAALQQYRSPSWAAHFERVEDCLDAL